ncbi:MAG: hypothetical protein HN348_25580 [Proteobacteria bacterium]|jgi:hypothetical protein|nr:hypothetical protein [Pseudomonadota bacterium]
MGAFFMQLIPSFISHAMVAASLLAIASSGCNKAPTVPAEWADVVAIEGLKEVNQRVTDSHLISVIYHSNNDESTMANRIADHMTAKGWKLECKPREKRRGLSKGDQRLALIVTKAGQRVVVDITDKDGDKSVYESVWKSDGSCK